MRDSNPQALAGASFQDWCNSRSANPQSQDRRAILPRQRVISLCPPTHRRAVYARDSLHLDAYARGFIRATACASAALNTMPVVCIGTECTMDDQPTAHVCQRRGPLNEPTALGSSQDRTSLARHSHDSVTRSDCAASICARARLSRVWSKPQFFGISAGRSGKEDGRSGTLANLYNTKRSARSSPAKSRMNAAES